MPILLNQIRLLAFIPVCRAVWFNAAFGVPVDTLSVIYLRARYAARKPNQ
jgi:hypothetical protein